MPSSVPAHRQRPITDAATRQRRRLTRSRARTESRQRILLAHIESRFARKRSRLEEGLREHGIRLEADLAEIEQRITAAHQEAPVQSRKAAEAARELEPFRNIGLARFMRFLLLP